MASERSPIPHCDQMRCVADSLKPIGSRFDNEISYEINGCILTWIANDSGLEHRFDCSNIIEIIDGYYKAEFYLDTKRIFEVPELIESYTNITDIRLTGYSQDQEDTKHISNDKTQKPDSSAKIDTLSNASTDADTLNEANSNPNSNTNTNTDTTPTTDIDTTKNKTSNSEDPLSNRSADQFGNSKTHSTSQSTQHSNNSTPHNDKHNLKPPSNIVKKTMETRNSTKITLSLRSSKTNKNLDSSTDLYNKDTAKSLNCYARIPQNEVTESIRQSEVKKRKIGKAVNIPVPSLT